MKNTENKIVMLDVDNLLDSPDNFFEVDGIDELAETILEQGGVKESLIVREVNSTEYEIISGHRRVAAVKRLIAQGENISWELPCLVQECKDDNEKKLNMVLMNVTSRVISNPELWKSYEIINEYLQGRKKQGEKFGKLQIRLAEHLGISTAQTHKLQNIDKRAIPEIKAAVADGDVSINVADKVSKLTPDEQKKLVDEKPLNELRSYKQSSKLSDKEKEALVLASLSPKDREAFERSIAFNAMTLEEKIADLERQLKAERTRAATTESKLARLKEVLENDIRHKDSTIISLQNQLKIALKNNTQVLFE
jgi:ParB-like chromosome segregation protein Spo0J